MNVNLVVLYGRLARDCEMRSSAKGTTVCSFGLAVNYIRYSGTDKTEETSFFDCAAFGKTGDAIGKYCRKGSEIWIQGHLKQETWQDKTSGQNRSKIAVHVDQMQLGPKDAQAAPPATAPQPAQAPARASSWKKPSDPMGELNPPDSEPDDVPF